MFKKIVFGFLSIVFSVIIISSVAIFSFVSAGKNIPTKAIKIQDYDTVAAMYIPGFFDSEDKIEIKIEKFGTVYIYSSIHEYEDEGLVIAEMASEILLFPDENIQVDKLKQIEINFQNGNTKCFKYIIKDKDGVILENNLRYNDELGFVPMTIYESDLEELVNVNIESIKFVADGFSFDYQFENDITLINNTFYSSLAEISNENIKLANEILRVKDAHSKEENEDRRNQLQNEAVDFTNKYNSNLNSMKELAREEGYTFSLTLNKIFTEPSFIIKVTSSVLVCVTIIVISGYYIFRKKVED